MSQNRESRLGARRVGQGSPLCPAGPTGTPVFELCEIQDSVVSAFPSGRRQLYLRVMSVSNCSFWKVNFEVRIGFGSWRNLKLLSLLSRKVRFTD